jgi:hypothetical protein
MFFLYHLNILNLNISITQSTSKRYLATHLISASYQHNQVQWLTQITQQGHELFPNIGIAKTFDNITLAGLFDVRHHTPTITLATPYFSTDISMQRLSYTKARQLQFNLNVHWLF